MPLFSVISKARQFAKQRRSSAALPEQSRRDFRAAESFSGAGSAGTAWH
jgi:hypothetical protein